MSECTRSKAWHARWPAGDHNLLRWLRRADRRSLPCPDGGAASGSCCPDLLLSVQPIIAGATSRRSSQRTASRTSRSRATWRAARLLPSSSAPPEAFPPTAAQSSSGGAADLLSVRSPPSLSRRTRTGSATLPSSCSSRCSTSARRASGKEQRLEAARSCSACFPRGGAAHARTDKAHPARSPAHAHLSPLSLLRRCASR